MSRARFARFDDTDLDRLPAEVAVPRARITLLELLPPIRSFLKPGH